MISNTSEDYDNPEQQRLMPLVEHLLELRRRLLVTIAVFLFTFFVCFYFAENIYSLLIHPLSVAMRTQGGSQRMIYTSVTEVFLTYMKVAAFSAFSLTFPVFATHMWLFIAPGLYQNEKKALLPFLIVTPILFLLGASLVYVFIMPSAWHYLLGFQSTVEETFLPIQLEAKVSEYLDIVMTLMFAFGACFELPVALTLMTRVGIVNADMLAKKRRFAIVGAFIIAAILTPPDVISQVGLALPLISLYEVSIVACRWIERRKNRSIA